MARLRRQSNVFTARSSNVTPASAKLKRAPALDHHETFEICIAAEALLPNIWGGKMGRAGRGDVASVLKCLHLCAGGDISPLIIGMWQNVAHIVRRCWPRSPLGIKILLKWEKSCVALT